MDVIQSIEEIKAQYPEEWVVINNPQVDDSLEVLAGEVVCHSPDRDELHEKIMTLHLTDFAVRCFKRWPEGMEFIL